MCDVTWTVPRMHRCFWASCVDTAKRYVASGLHGTYQLDVDILLFCRAVRCKVLIDHWASKNIISYVRIIRTMCQIQSPYRQDQICQVKKNVIASKRYFHTHVHNSIIHRSQSVRQKINEETKEWNIIQPSKGRLSTRYDMGEHRGHNALWKKPVTKGQMLWDFTYRRSLEYSDPQRQKVEWQGRGAEGKGNRELLFHGYSGSVLRDEKSSGDGWLRWLHNNVNALHATELRMDNGQSGKVRVTCVLHQLEWWWWWWII